MIRVGQCLGASYFQLFRDIIIPQLSLALGWLVIGMGNAWFCLVQQKSLQVNMVLVTKLGSLM